MQFTQENDEIVGDLPKPSIDTGMGIERVAAVMQGVHDNYDTDTFKALIGASEALTGVNAEGDQTASHRVIADHLRSTSFLLADGVLPSNEGRGYVLRRILRRAVRFGRQQLGIREPFIHGLVPVVVEAMGDAFPELKMRTQRVVRGREVICTAHYDTMNDLLSYLTDQCCSGVKLETDAAADVV
jgi:alanyl-tRNA synthetase